MISSANLTAYGLDANMELGLIVRGDPIPQRIAGHFRQLIRDGTLEPWSDHLFSGGSGGCTNSIETQEWRDRPDVAATG
jgi:hypothetical protein